MPQSPDSKTKHPYASPNEHSPNHISLTPEIKSIQESYQQLIANLLKQKQEHNPDLRKILDKGFASELYHLVEILDGRSSLMSYQLTQIYDTSFQAYWSRKDVTIDNARQYIGEFEHLLTKKKFPMNTQEGFVHFTMDILRAQSDRQQLIKDLIDICYYKLGEPIKPVDRSRYDLDSCEPDSYETDHLQALINTVGLQHCIARYVDYKVSLPVTPEII